MGKLTSTIKASLVTAIYLGQEIKNKSVPTYNQPPIYSYGLPQRRSIQVRWQRAARKQGDAPGTGSAQEHASQQSSSGSSGGGGFLGGLGDKLNSAAGGGKESEKNEDYLDKGVDFVQEKFMGQGPQDNESAVEQAKDEQISDFIRAQYKGTTGKDFPVADKETRFG